MQSAEPTAYEIEHDRLCSLNVHPVPDPSGYWRPGLTYQQWLFGRILPVMISKHARLGDAICATESAIMEILRREAEAEVGDESA